MHVRTDKCGITVIHGEVAQAPTLESRVSRELAALGVRSTSKPGSLHTRACALVRTYPAMSARQAVAYLVDRL